MAPNRDRPALCYHIIDLPAMRADAVHDRFRQALAIVAQSERWRELALSPDAVDLKNGCPLPPFLLEPGVPLPFTRDAAASRPQRNVRAASLETAFVWILPEPTMARLFGDNGRHVAPEEYLCEGDMCAEVTEGLYLSPSDLDDLEALARKLQGVLIW
jgi:hypothetical protein